MAIHWTDFTYTEGTYSRTVTGQRITHEGLVVGPKYGQEARVMSDVWDTHYACVVWNPTTNKSEVVGLYWADMSQCQADVVVDAPPEIMGLFEAEQAALKAERERLERERAEASARERERERWDRPEKGKVMQVVRGRKVPRGTIGRVFWLDSMLNPTRVGLALSQEQDATGRFTKVAWVDAAYLVNTAPHPELDA